MKTYQIQPTDVSESAMLVMKTVLLLDKAFSISYLVRLLRGDKTYPLRQEEHEQLETFGSMEETSLPKIEGLLHFLQKQAYLSIEDPRFGTIAITDRGTEYLSDPKPMLANRRQLGRSWLENNLYRELKSLRKELATSMEVAPYELYNNYGLHCLATQMPESSEAIQAIPAASEMPEACKKLVLEKIHDALQLKAKDERSGGLYTKAHSPSHQAIKRLFEEGCSLEEIAAARTIKPGTVRTYLSNLHRSEQLDLRKWIEEHWDERVLHRGTEYFEQSNDKRLKPAHESLGLDYETLEWCKLYYEICLSQPMALAS
ncbi:MAG: RQC domain-containing protein [Bacteroidota bacterium]